MTRFDELDEQTRRQWRSRLEKGRADLSASVEQTLAEGAAEGVWMDEDGEEGGTQVVNEHAGEVRRGTAVIPPRLSLQTKPMYTVPAANRSAMPLVESHEVQEHSQEKQHSGVFSRLAQRITMSLAAITLPFQGQAPQSTMEEMPVPLSSLLPPQNVSMQTVTTVRVERSETTTTIIESSPIHYAVPQAGLSSVHSVPQLPQSEQSVQGEGKSRPAGQPSKVHLEAAPKSASLHQSSGASERGEAASYPVHDRTEPIPLRNTFSIPHSAPTIELPTVSAASVEEVMEATGAVYDLTTSGRLPSVSVQDRGSSELALQSPSRTIFGAGSFDPGQGDVALACPSITGKSVVMVMLASDPGPVVVQYISLQPGIGFTVHLSAPTKVKTLFNYVAFREEG